MIDRAVREVIRENNTILKEYNYANITLKNNDNKVDIIVRNIFFKGISNSITQ